MPEATAPTTKPGTTDEPPLRIGVLLFDGVEPLDAIGPAQVFWSLRSARGLVPAFRPVEVFLVGETGAPITAGYDLVVQPTASYESCPPLDALIVPGGTGGEDDDRTARIGRRFQSHHEPTLTFVRDQAAHAQLVTSVCTGTFILAGAGLLADHRGNTHWSARAELEQFMRDRDEKFTLEVARVVDDGDVITAGGVSSGIDLALHLVDKFLGPACREAASMIIERETPGVA
jgi:cyclohexyl-isocyanide hydratase